MSCRGGSVWPVLEVSESGSSWNFMIQNESV
ncbi:hypothetical protein V6Z11_D09G262600 [Gossypium hirsutum]